MQLLTYGKATKRERLLTSVSVSIADEGAVARVCNEEERFTLCLKTYIIVNISLCFTEMRCCNE